MTLPMNSTIGDYQLTEYIGAGGMGEVYRAVHSRLKRVCAIKVLTHLLPGSHSAERFLNEARIQAGLQHPNIVTLYELIEHQGKPCIVMELIRGQTLDQRISQTGMLPIAEVVLIYKELLEAVQYMHEHGIVHRDIKSNNIKISCKGKVKLLDFGIAKDSVSPNLTMTDACIGTPQNLAPEQIQGKTVDERTDIWALGIILYEMCVGRLPFPEQPVSELYRKIICADYVAPEALNPALPGELVSIINRCLQKRPIQRYSSVKVILRDLDRYSQMHSHSGFCLQDNGLLSRTLAALKQSITTYWPLLSAACLLLTMIAGSVFLYEATPRADINLSVIKPVNKEQRPSPGTGMPASSYQKTVRITVIGEPAEVYLDGKMIGLTPVSFKRPPGTTMSLEFKRPCYQVLKREITVQKSQDLYTYQLQPINPFECE